MTIKGYIDSFVFKNPEETFGVFNIISDDVDGEECTCVGTVKGLTVGLFVSLEGEYTEHKKFGHQFKFNTYEITKPTDSVAVERFLASGAIKGIGPVLAIRIVKKFKDDTLKIIEEQPERLAEVRGISERKAREIAQSLMEQKDVRDALMFMQEYGISNNMAVKIYDYYGPTLYTVIRENPYRIAEDIKGIGFRKIDELAIKSGFLMDSEERIKAGIHYCLTNSQADGNTYLPKDVLYEETKKIFEIEYETFDKCITDMSIEGKLTVREDKIFLSYVYSTELKSAVLLKKLSEAVDEDNTKAFEKYKEKLINDYDIKLDETQLDAVQLSTQSGVFILTGGPGTGKTTTISAMINYFRENGMDVALAAPTGRAAKRMEERTGFCAKTIHRLLEVNGGGDNDTPKFNRNEDNPLETDVVIVDEFSMVDAFLFYSLLKAMTPGMRLIITGDSNQLPSVGPGNVLKDIIESGAFKCACLEKIYRQQDRSDIIVNAHSIIEGNRPKMDNDSDDFFFLERDEAAKLYRDLVLLVRDKLTKQFKVPAYEVQVLCPAKKGPFGVEMLNKILQSNLNPPNVTKAELQRNEGVFRVGDKVMQMKNDYNAAWHIYSPKGRYCVEEGEGIFNGDVGVITKIDRQAASITVCFEDNKEVEYSSASLDELELAYAITIHKSQGCEYPAAVLVLVDGPQMLFTRNLLYTAVTRASRCVMILGSRKTVFNMVDNEGDYKRYTDFTNKIKEVMSY